ncbi:STN domain-containing protein [Methylorubrum thiocyanatum]
MRGLRLGAVAVGLLATAGAGRAEEVYAFDIPRGDLATVLTRIALEGRLPIVFPANLVRGREVGPINCYDTAEAALKRALAGTDLEIGRGASGVLTVRRMAATPAAPGSGGHEAADFLPDTANRTSPSVVEARAVGSALDLRTETRP